MDDLVQYEFMEEVQSELFDGSTSGKTLKDAGIDFNQKLNVFYGRNNNYEVSGFTFGISSLKDLLRVFDDFDKAKVLYNNIIENKGKINFKEVLESVEIEVAK
jgi:hypothetical protein